MKEQGEDQGEAPTALWREEGGGLVLELKGDWIRGRKLLENEVVGEKWPTRFEVGELGEYDSMLPAYLLRVFREVGGEGSFDGLPEDLKGLMELTLRVPERSDAKGGDEDLGFLGEVGLKARAWWVAGVDVLGFFGELVIAVFRFFTGRAKFRWDEFRLILQDCGVNALPIVSLISFLIGMILAFVGNVQLENFGASIYVADLVGIAMVREMGVMMTAIIMSGRTGAAFAAHIGSMNANEEIDALKTFGFNPFDYLVLPRVFALVLMMPLLTVYSNVIGILGGMAVGAGVGIPPKLFWNELLSMVDLTQASLGVIKSVFFAVVIALAGCYQGMKSGGSSAAVGQATTRAVVASITLIIVLDSLFAVIFTILDI